MGNVFFILSSSITIWALLFIEAVFLMDSTYTTRFFIENDIYVERVLQKPGILLIILFSLAIGNIHLRSNLGKGKA